MATAPGTGTSVTCSVAPRLSVRQGARAVEFYKAAFGAVEVYRVEAPDGAVVSRLSVKGAEFWVADESPEHHNFSPESLGGGTVRPSLGDRPTEPMKRSRTLPPIPLAPSSPESARRSPRSHRGSSSD